MKNPLLGTLLAARVAFAFPAFAFTAFAFATFAFNGIAHAARAPSPASANLATSKSDGGANLHLLPDSDGKKTNPHLLADEFNNPVTDLNRDPLRNYYGNSYSCYHGFNAVCQHWWNPDGTEQFFSVEVLPEGLVTMRTIDGLHASWTANNQWCSWNTRTRMGRAPLDPFEDLDYAEKNNNENGCSPVVDGQPGDHWEKLHLDGNLKDEREQYTLMPGWQ